jgi:predicted DNA-binding transcriptional regulator YafY
LRVRTARCVERIVAAQELAERFERPLEFDLERYWRESMMRFAEESRNDQYAVLLRVRGEGIDTVTFFWSSEIVERGASESLVRVTFPSEGIAISQAIAWIEIAEIVEPAELRDHVAARAKAALAVYSFA